MIVVGTPDGRFYSMGGDEGRNSTCEFFSPENKTWSFCAPMQQPRCGHSCVLGSDGRIYVFGSDNGLYTDRRSAECYDPLLNMWYWLPSLPQVMDHHAAVSLPNGKIYLFGGKNEYGEETQSCFCFDLQTRGYSRLQDMPFRSFHCLAARLV